MINNSSFVELEFWIFKTSQSVFESICSSNSKRDGWESAALSPPSNKKGGCDHEY